MNKKKLKLIKKAVYKGGDTKVVEYKTTDKGQIVADIQRSVYQVLKRECRNMNKKQIAEHIKRS